MREGNEWMRLVMLSGSSIVPADGVDFTNRGVGLARYNLSITGANT
ncbi:MULTISPECIES: hypothetical protein [Paenibacillus]|nr:MULTISPECIES: hypothetical protein [Paenibacillus]